MKFDFKASLDEFSEYGVIVEVHHPMVITQGITSAKLREIVVFEDGSLGETFVLEEDKVAILVYSNSPLKVGMKVGRTGKFVSVPVSNKLLGSVITPLGENKRTGSEIEGELREIDVAPLGIPARTRINKPLLTGVSIIDMMIPLGRGQKELVIGDRKSGKTSFLFSTILNQVSRGGTIAVYAAVGKKKSDIARISRFFEQRGIAPSTILVATEADDSPSLIFQTPYAAMTIAEYFRDLGHDVVVVFDDLSTHARFYREVSLLAKRFPGRESYPGDIFYTHARLLERAGNFKYPTPSVPQGAKSQVKNVRDEVSITALPVAELVNGDFAGYIPTNLMGMTDGHIYFDANQYFEGRRPAVNISLSVTRVGKQATSSLVRSINREVTAFLTLYEKMQNLSHFGAELTPTVRHVIETGEMIYVFFQQPYTKVIPQSVQIVLFAMIWLKFIGIAEKNNVEQYATNLLNSYHNPKVKQQFDGFLESETLNDLLGKVSQSKDQLLSLCRTNDKSKKN